MAVDQTTKATLIPELEGRAAEFAAAKQDLQQLVEGLTDDEFNWRPSEESWSMAECFDHLCMLGNLVVPRIDEGIEQAQARGWRSDGPFKYGRIGNYFIRLAGPNQRRKFKAPAIYTPSSNHSISRIVKSFGEMQDEFVDRVHKANGLDLARVKIANPAVPILKLSLGQWFALLSGHQQRHYQQAEHVKEQMKATAE